MNRTVSIIIGVVSLLILVALAYVYFASRTMTQERQRAATERYQEEIQNLPAQGPNTANSSASPEATSSPVVSPAS